MIEEQQSKFEALLDYLRRTRAFDFSGYKRSSLMRRVQKRLDAIGITDFVDYVDYLEVHPEEFSALFNTILINVTEFFRDASAWEYIQTEVIPRILAEKPEGSPIRLWSAGCSSGEEAYSLAILLAEALGPEAFSHRVKIYATDVDDDALSQARSAAYPMKSLDAMSVEWRDKYFELVNGRYVFSPELRRTVIFGRHDLIQDAPISRLDLLVCRNTLMYLNAETQGKILSRFHFALNDLGFLFLGKAEMLLTYSTLFNAVNVRYRVFAKTAVTALRDRLKLALPASDRESVNQVVRQVRVQELAFEMAPIAQMVVDTHGVVVAANERLRSLFGLRPKSLNRPLEDMEISYRPVDLRALIDRAYAERRPATAVNVERHIHNEDPQYLDIQATPLTDNGGSFIGVSITFEDVTSDIRLQQEIQRSSQELEAAYQELQSTHEELETTNEELQSSNEELETTNEELQSTNEELETMNEELHSSNEELETMNDELRQRTDSLNKSHGFLKSILASIPLGVVMVDRAYNILIWNHRVEDQWGLRSDEVVGRSLLTLDIGLPVEVLKAPIRDFLAGKGDIQDMVVNAINRRGRAVKCIITGSPYIGSDGVLNGVVLTIAEVEK